VFQLVKTSDPLVSMTNYILWIIKTKANQITPYIYKIYIISSNSLEV